MGFPPQMGPLKSKLFNLLSLAHEIFKISKHKQTIKFDKVSGYQNGSTANWAYQNSNFLITHARRINFSG